MVSMLCPVWFAVVFRMLTTSGNPIATARLEFLMRLTQVVARSGTIARRACGMITMRSVWKRESAERRGRVALAARHGEHGAAHHLRDVRGVMQHERREERGQLGRESDAADEVEAREMRRLDGRRPAQWRTTASERHREHGASRPVPMRRLTLRAWKRRPTAASERRSGPLDAGDGRQHEAAIGEEHAAHRD